MQQMRGEIVDEVIGYLRDAVSVNLVGLRQSGRSQAIRLVADQLREDDLAVIVVRGVAALRDRPLAVLALAGVHITPGNAALTVSNTVTALAKLLPPGESVLIIDDADDLDCDSIGAVIAAHRRQRFPVLSVTRPGGHRQTTGHTLTSQLHPGVRVMLDPLSFDQLHHTIQQMLPGPADSSTIAQIAMLSGGLPGLMAAIVDTGRRTGSITADRGIWRVKDSLWDARLAPAVEPLLADLTDGELDALASLSFVRTVTVAEARKIVPEHMLARLQELGLIQVAATPANPMVGIFPPLLAEYLRRTGTATTQLPVLAVAPAGADTGAAALAPRLALTSSRAAILNMRIAEYWQAEIETLRTAWRENPGPERAEPLLFALNAAMAEPAEIATIIAGTRLDGADPMWQARFAGADAAYRALVLDDPEDAWRYLREQRAELPAFASQLRAAEAVQRLLLGPLPDAELLAPAEPGEDPRGAEYLTVMRVATLLAQGRTVDARAALPSHAPQHPYYAEVYRVCAGLTRVLHGDFDDGVQWALRAMADAEDGFSFGEIHAHAYVAALGLAYAGRLADLDALLGPVLSLTSTTALHNHYRAGLLALAAQDASWRGRSDLSRSFTVQAEAIGRHPGPFPGMVHGVVPIHGDQREHLADAGERLWCAVAERFANGYLAAGVALAVIAVEAVPDADRAAVAAGHARATQSPFLAALGEYIAAAGAGDLDALAKCVADLRACGARLPATKAAITRSLVLRAREQIDASVRQAEEAWALSAELGQGYRGLFLRLGHAVGLNSREREIAAMVRQGVTAQSIASLLGLSARTVENYLFSGYRKLGCESRDDLVQAISTWAALE